MTLHVKRKRYCEELLNFCASENRKKAQMIFATAKFPLELIEWLGCVTLQKCVALTLRLCTGVIIFNKI